MKQIGIWPIVRGAASSIAISGIPCEGRKRNGGFWRPKNDSGRPAGGFGCSKLEVGIRNRANSLHDSEALAERLAE
jgi:hypothetical protein